MSYYVIRYNISENRIFFSLYWYAQSPSWGVGAVWIRFLVKIKGKPLDGTCEPFLTPNHHNTDSWYELDVEASFSFIFSWPTPLVRSYCRSLNIQLNMQIYFVADALNFSWRVNELGNLLFVSCHYVRQESRLKEYALLIEFLANNFCQLVDLF